MKRILISAIALAVLIAGCGSGGSTTPAASKAKTSTSSTTTKTTTHKRHKVIKKKVTKKKKVVKKPSTGGSAVTTTAVTTTAATTSAAPPPPTTTTHTAPPPTTTHSAPPPVTTHQQPPPKKHHHNGGHGGGYCLAATDRIATPTGSVPVTQVKPGMHVWSTDRQGRRISVKVVRVHHTAVPSSHLMVRLHLSDGRTVLASLGHPLPDGQAIKTLAVGQRFEGSRVVSDARVRYGRPYTYDLLPAGPTHTYYANGVLLGSTLAPLDFTHLF